MVCADEEDKERKSVFTDTTVFRKREKELRMTQSQFHTCVLAHELQDPTLAGDCFRKGWELNFDNIVKSFWSVGAKEVWTKKKVERWLTVSVEKSVSDTFSTNNWGWNLGCWTNRVTHSWDYFLPLFMFKAVLKCKLKTDEGTSSFFPTVCILWRIWALQKWEIEEKDVGFLVLESLLNKFCLEKKEQNFMWKFDCMSFVEYLGTLTTTKKTDFEEKLRSKSGKTNRLVSNHATKWWKNSLCRVNCQKKKEDCKRDSFITLKLWFEKKCVFGLLFNKTKNCEKLQWPNNKCFVLNEKSGSLHDQWLCWEKTRNGDLMWLKFSSALKLLL